MERFVIAGVAAVVLLALVVGGGCFVFGQQPTPLAFTGAATTIDVRQGQTFTIDLDANRTTGYQWQLGAPLDPAVALFEGASYSSSGNQPGAGGRETLTFRALGRGNAQINLVYVRPWETGVAPARTSTIALTVR